MPTVIQRVEDLLKVSQLTTGALFYCSQSGTPFNTNAWDIANSISGTNIFATVILLGTSGQALSSQINSLSGYANNVFYLQTNPQQYIKSGDVSSTYATITNLQSTGQRDYILITGLSGALNQTGANLQNQINNLVVNAGVSKINGISGIVTITGISGTVVTTVGQTISISGGGGSSIVPSVFFTTNVDWSLANTFYANVNGVKGISFTNNIDGKSIVIATTNSNSGLLSWPNNVKWPNGNVPTPSSGAIDVYTFVQVDTGIYGTVISNFS